MTENKTQKDINKGNKIIAVYMGANFKNSICIAPGELPNFLDPNTTIHNLKFHKSWDWLMPVVIKISEKDDIYKVGIANLMSNYGYKILDVWSAIIKHITHTNK